MSVSFSYSTVEEVDNDTRRAILSEASRLNDNRHWTSTERFIFFEPEGDETQMYGDSKFFPNNVHDEPDDIPDIVFIMRILCDWSNRFRITWQITAEEVEVGRISLGETDSKIDSFVRALSDGSLNT